MPAALIDALLAQRARDLTIVNNNGGNGDTGLAALLKARRVRKIVCAFPDSPVFDGRYHAGEIGPPQAIAPGWPRARKRD
jgi:3-oxoadipate CoA-transferase alpha subunit